MEKPIIETKHMSLDLETDWIGIEVAINWKCKMFYLKIGVLTLRIY